MCKYLPPDYINYLIGPNWRTFAYRHWVTEMLSLAKSVYLKDRLWAARYCTHHVSWFMLKKGTSSNLYAVDMRFSDLQITLLSGSYPERYINELHLIPPIFQSQTQSINFIFMQTFGSGGASIKCWSYDTSALSYPSPAFGSAKTPSSQIPNWDKIRLNQDGMTIFKNI